MRKESHSPGSNGGPDAPAFSMPLSTLLSDDSREVFRRQAKEAATLSALMPPPDDVLGTREKLAAHFVTLVSKMKARYPVNIHTESIAGVVVHIVDPSRAVTALGHEHVLICLHGGGFIVGGGTGALIEAIPIAALGQVRVISVDYRMAPEHQHPAATEDVLAVYDALLKSYDNKNIGIYGCSAGGLLTAQAVSRLQALNLPTPGAVAMLASGAAFYRDGDSGHFQAALRQTAPPTETPSTDNPYFRNVDPTDVTAFPARSKAALAAFPPTLLLTSTRDQALSSVVYTHSKLVAAGVDARLHVWEGLNHAFMFEPDFSESREAYDVVVRFFEKHLGPRNDTSAVLSAV